MSDQRQHPAVDPPPDHELPIPMPVDVTTAGLPAHADPARSEPHWFNFPNGLTFLRALLVPVILWLLAREDPASRWWAFGIFIFAAFTDSVDGWVARRWNGVTRWGQLADPIADKLLIIGSLASLAAVGELPWWAVGVIVIREVAVTLLRVLLVQRHGIVMPASWWGKGKTISQVVAVSAFLMPAFPDTGEKVLLAIAITLTVVSGMEYGFRAGSLVPDPEHPLERRREAAAEGGVTTGGGEEPG